jgi:protein required for attachment to host cells
MLSDLTGCLIVIADGEHARFVQAAADDALKTQRMFDSTMAHHRLSELISDRPGASFHSMSTAHHSVTPKHDPREMAKESFARYVAEQVNMAASQDEFRQLLLVAPARVLTEIKAGLDQVAHARIAGTDAQDLVKVPDHELQPHLKAWIRPTHRAG